MDDHRETERRLTQLANCLNQTDWALRLPEQVAQLEAQLASHYVLEEQALLTMLHPYRTMMLLEAEHDDLLIRQRDFTDTARQEAQPDESEGPQQHPPSERLRTRFDAFQSQLRAHLYQEDHRIFPWAESVLSPEEKQTVLRRRAELEQAQHGDHPPRLIRPVPQWAVRATHLMATDTPSARPLQYETLYEREHSRVQHIRLRAGHGMNRHWSGQHQCIVVISGQVRLQCDDGEALLSPGDEAILDSRLYFSLHALSDTHLLSFQVWPHPHYTKT